MRKDQEKSEVPKPQSSPWREGGNAKGEGRAMLSIGPGQAREPKRVSLRVPED